MNKLNCILVLVIFIVSCQSPNHNSEHSAKDKTEAKSDVNMDDYFTWLGKFENEDENGVDTELVVDSLGITYQSIGIQRYFIVNCRATASIDSLKVYYESTLDGAFYPSDWIDKTLPIFVLARERNGKLITINTQNTLLGGDKVDYFKRSGK